MTDLPVSWGGIRDFKKWGGGLFWNGGLIPYTDYGDGVTIKMPYGVDVLLH